MWCRSVSMWLALHTASLPPPVIFLSAKSCLFGAYLSFWAAYIYLWGRQRLKEANAGTITTGGGFLNGRRFAECLWGSWMTLRIPPSAPLNWCRPNGHTDTRSIQPRDSDHVSVNNKVCSLQCDNRTGTDKQQSTKLAFVSHVEENEVCNIWCQASNVTGADENGGQIKLSFDIKAEGLPVCVLTWMAV